MPNYQYYPYEELNVEIKSKDEISFRLPWLELSLKTHAEEAKEIARLFYEAQQGLGLSQNLNEVLNHFSQYPVSYILPQKKKTTDDLKNSESKSANFQSKIEHILQPLNFFSSIDWEWDHQAAITFSSIDDQVCPESLLSVARKFHHIQLLESDKGNQVLQHISQLEEKSFIQVMSILIRQNHYVTQKCEESLQGALKTAGDSMSKVQDFMGEERGHDKILTLALTRLLGKPSDPETIPVVPEAKAIMSLLKLASEENFLAFCLAVDFFERSSSYGKIDPVAKLLLDKGFNDSGEQLARHTHINEEGDHASVALGFLEHHPMCNKDYALSAIQFAEILSRVMCRVTEAAWDLYLEIKENS